MKTIRRGSYHRINIFVNLSTVNLSTICQIEELWIEICGYIGFSDAHAKFNASDEVSLMIRRKRGKTKLKKCFDDTRLKEAKRTKIIADNFRNIGDVKKEKVEWDRLRNLLTLLYKENIRDQREVQKLISTYWSLEKEKICVALFMEGLPSTTKGILNIHERYLNNLTATRILNLRQEEI